MPQLEFTDHLMKVANVNPRVERHGEEKVLAADLKLEAETK